MVREARERWRKSGCTPGFEGMARMPDLAFKLKQFAAGMPSEIKEVHSTVTGKVSIEWEEAIRKAYGQVEVQSPKPKVRRWWMWRRCRRILNIQHSTPNNQ